MATSPRTGSLRDVLDFAQPFAAADFDRARPLWEMVVLEGLEDGRAALVQKVHHSLADGVGMMKLTMAFLDIEAEPSTELGPRAGAAGRADPRRCLEQVRSAVAYQTKKQAAAAGALPRHIADLARIPSGSAAERGEVGDVRCPHASSRPLSP